MPRNNAGLHFDQSAGYHGEQQRPHAPLVFCPRQGLCQAPGRISLLKNKPGL